MQNAQPVQHTFTGTVKEPMSVEQRDKLLLSWKEAKQQLETAKNAEMALRKMIVEDSGLFDATKEKGTQRVNLGEGWQIKVEKKINWTTKAELEDGRHIDDALELIEASAGKLAADELVKFKPEVKMSIYNKLTPEQKEIIDPFLTSSPASPSLELIPPKA